MAVSMLCCSEDHDDGHSDYDHGHRRHPCLEPIHSQVAPLSGLAGSRDCQTRPCKSALDLYTLPR